MGYHLGMGSGSEGTLTATAAAAGTTQMTLRPGLFVLAVRNETVEISNTEPSGGTLVAGIGSPWVPGTQIIIRIDSNELWTLYSAGGTGVVFLTKLS